MIDFEQHPSGKAVSNDLELQRRLQTLQRKWCRLECKPQIWSDDNLTVITDSPSYNSRLRVFPVFGDENILLSRIVTQVGAKTVLDIGTGSGILALAAAQAGAKVDAVDINPRALSFAKVNATHNAVANRICFKLADVFPEVRSRFDLIVTNPPFVPNPLCGRFNLASNGGRLGTQIIERILKGTNRYLADDGLLIMTAVSLQTQETPYLVKLAKQILGKDFKVTTYPIYERTLPVAQYTALFDWYPKSWQWSHSLQQRGFDSLIYFVLVATRTYRSLAHLPILPETTALSGSWDGRLRRYRLWLNRPA
jgi:HemK-related putative methylase